MVGLDVLDVELHNAALPTTSRHPGGSGLGYGATREEARTGALGEMAEMALSARALAGAPRVEASFADLVRKEGAGRVQDPRTLALEAGSPYDDDRVLQWLPMTRLRDGESVLVPAELVASAAGDLPGPPPPGGWLTTVITQRPGRGFRRRAGRGRTPCSRCCSATATRPRSARWTGASSSTSTVCATPTRSPCSPGSTPPAST